MSTDGVPRPHDWKHLYELALIELDPAKLPQRISDARIAVLDRIRENGAKPYDPHDYHEHEELCDAINGLRVLKQEYERRVQQYGQPPQQKMG